MNQSPESNDGVKDDAAEDRVRRAYRSASASLNETPSAAVRAAVLAAAARAVQARPTGVAADGVAPALRGKPRYRMPLAAAASVLVGTIAVLLVQRTEERLPAQGEPTEATVRADQSTAPVAAVQPKPADAAPAAAAQPDRAALSVDSAATAVDGRTDPARRQQLAQSAAVPQRRANELRPQESGAPVGSAPEWKLLEYAAPAPAAASAPAVESAENRAAGAATGRVSAEAQQASPQRESADAATRTRESTAAPSAVTPPPSTVREEPAAVRAAERDARAPAAQSALKKVARSDEPAPVTPPEPASVPAVPPTDRVIGRPVQRTAPIAEAPGAPGLVARVEPAEVSPNVAADPKRWLERIVRLRAEGRHDLADAELKALRARYPDVAIPQAARR